MGFYKLYLYPRSNRKRRDIEKRTYKKWKEVEYAMNQISKEKYEKHILIHHKQGADIVISRGKLEEFKEKEARVKFVDSLRVGHTVEVKHVMNKEEEEEER